MKCIFIGIGNNGIGNDIGKSTSVSESQADDESSAYDGPVVEVVVGSGTTVYQEVLDLGQPSTSGEIQQEVTEGTIEDIGDTSYMWVWGRKVGDRIIADVLLYSVPIMKPASVP